MEPSKTPTTDSPPPASRILIPPRKTRHDGLSGIGDVVALAAKPAARMLDRVFGTDWSNCQECEQRRQDWNAKVPFRK